VRQVHHNALEQVKQPMEEHILVLLGRRQAAHQGHQVLLQKQELEQALVAAQAFGTSAFACSGSHRCQSLQDRT